MTKIVAEIAQAHDGSLGILHSYIDSIARLDIDIIKFQTHIAAAESSNEEKFRKNFSYLGESRFDYWKRMEFSFDQWLEIKKHCDDKKIEFMSTPFSNQAVDLLEKMNVKRYKVGSGDTNNYLMLDRILQTNKPIIISSGLSDYQELDAVIEHIRSQTQEVTLLQCTSSYPTKMDEIGLNLIEDYRNRYQISVGLSDHSGQIYPSLAAAALKADIIEVHVVFDQMMFGPDSTSSINISRMGELVEGIRMIDAIMSSPIEKTIINSTTKEVFSRTLAFNKDLSKGELVKFKHLESKKPGGLGIHPKNYKTILNKALNQDVSCWQFITNDLFND
jgi:N,N'-diacetyllegionaminate synthase